MTPYPHHIERTMRSFYQSLRENDRRRYAAVEAGKLGHGEIEYIASVLGVDPKTIAQAQRDLDDLSDQPKSRVRKAGGGRKRKLEIEHLGTSHDTSEFACDCLKDWWERFGRAAYPRAKSLMLLCDGGGSNPADTDRGQAHLFRSDVQRLVNDLGIEIRVAHYPPYASKYHPIEHRLFPHLSRVCRGVILQNVELVAELMRKAKTRTGLSAEAEILGKVYEIGRKIGQATKDAVNLIRDPVLPRWNYRILPNM
jgi:hypothetical protein